MTTILQSPKELLELKPGAALGSSEWLQINQPRIEQFADATNDHQWIHIDVERAAKGPFGATIAHGYLTLSLVSWMLEQIIVVKNHSMGINYGCEKVRFPAPVTVGSRVRGSGELVSAAEISEGCYHVVVRVTVEVENGEKPVCVVDSVSRFYA